MSLKDLLSGLGKAGLDALMKEAARGSVDGPQFALLCTFAIKSGQPQAVRGAVFALMAMGHEADLDALMDEPNQLDSRQVRKVIELIYEWKRAFPSGDTLPARRPHGGG